MTAAETRGRRARQMVPWIVGGAVVLAGFVWWRSNDPPADRTTEGAQRADREANEEARPPREGRRPAAQAPAEGDAPADDDHDVAAAPAPRNGDAPAPSGEAAEEDPLRAVRAGMADPSSKGTKALVAQLTSKDEVVVAEAANALIERRAVEAIPAIAGIDLVTARGSGLSLIDALGRLGAVADASGRTVAVERLLAMLAEEKKRGAPESGANLIQIYEALGKLGDARAARALEAELVDPTVPRAPKVVIVKSLVTIGQHESRAALTTARAQQASQKGEDDFQEEIRVELVAELDRALQEI